MFNISTYKAIFFINFRNSTFEDHDTLRLFHCYSAFLIICLVISVVILSLIAVTLNHGHYRVKDFDQETYYSPKDWKWSFHGYHSAKSEDLDMGLTEKVHTEDYYETTGSEETTLPFDVDNDYESEQQTEEKVMYLDPILFNNLLLDRIKVQKVKQREDVQHVINEENDFRYIFMYDRHRDDQAVGGYEKIKSKHAIMNVLLGRDADVPNKLLEKQSKARRQSDGNDNVVIYEPTINKRKFTKHYLERYADMQNMFLIKQIKKDTKVQRSAYDSRKNNNQITIMFFDESANSTPQVFQNKQFNFLKRLFLNSGEQKNEMTGIMVNYREKNETNKNENNVDRNKNNIWNSKMNEGKENISIDDKKEILFKVQVTKDKENIRDIMKKDKSLNTEVENDNSETNHF